MSTLRAAASRCLVAACLLFAGAAPQAETLDASLDCRQRPHDFVAGLIARGQIEASPGRVEDNSVNVFWTRPGADLHAYGHRVFAVLAYAARDPLFRPGKGRPVADAAYGAMLFAATDEVARAAARANSPALIHHAAPHVTAVFCKSDAAAAADLQP